MGGIHVWWLLSWASSPKHNPTAAAKALIPEAFLLHEAFQAFICFHTPKPKSLTSSALLPHESIVSTPLTSYVRLRPSAKDRASPLLESDPWHLAQHIAAAPWHPVQWPTLQTSLSFPTATLQDLVPLYFIPEAHQQPSHSLCRVALYLLHRALGTHT